MNANQRYLMLEMEVSLPQHRIPSYCFIYDWLRSTGLEDGRPTCARKKKLARVAPLSGPSVTIIILCPGCSKTFANPGKLRKDHEEKHEPPVPDESQGANILKSTLSHEDDDMLCYQRSLLDYGMLVLNFLDGISEGDGEL